MRRACAERRQITTGIDDRNVILMPAASASRTAAVTAAAAASQCTTSCRDASFIR
jgi:hypothetical protein